jgi:hypothetical protein
LVASNNQGNYISSVSSSIFASNKNCLSCGNASLMLPGIKSSLIYHPSQILYKDKFYQRHELVSLKGKIIKNCLEASKFLFKTRNTSSNKAKNTRIKSLTNKLKPVLEPFNEIPPISLSTPRNQRKSRYSIKNPLKTSDKL